MGFSGHQNEDLLGGGPTHKAQIHAIQTGPHAHLEGRGQFRANLHAGQLMRYVNRDRFLPNNGIVNEHTRALKDHAERFQRPGPH